MARMARLASTVFVPFALWILGLVFVASTLPGCGGGGGGGGGVAGTVLGGTVTVPGSPAVPVGGGPVPEANISDVVVQAVDADGAVVASATTDSTGAYEMTLPAGTYQVEVQVGSLNFFTPLPSPVIVRGGGTIDGATEVSGKETLDFEAPAPSFSIGGTVTASGSGAANVVVEFVDTETDSVRFQATTASDGSFSVAVLPLGQFLVRIASTSLPSGLAAPTPLNLAVTTSGVSPTSLTFALPAATTLSGGITETSGLAPLVGLSPEGNPQPPILAEVPLTIEDDAVVIIIEIGYGVVARVPIASAGTYDLDLRDGSYRLEFKGFGSDVVAPPPILITVKGGLVFTEDQDTPLDPANSDQLGVVANQVSATLTGTVSRAGAGVLTRVIALNPATQGIVAETDTNDSGVYSLPLADGSYDITLKSSLLPQGVIPPNPVRVAVEAGGSGAAIKEEAGTENDGIVDFNLASANATLTGIVQDGASLALKDVRVRARKGDITIAKAVTNAAGEYTLQLPLGTIDVSVNPDTVPTGLLSPDAVRIEVTSVGGVPTITGTAGAITSLNLTLDARSPNVTGNVTFDFDGNSTIDAGEVVGCTIVVKKPETGQVVLRTPSDPATGAYSLVLKNGSYSVGVDPETLPPGSAPPPRRRLSVTDSGVTLADGTSGTSVALNFQLIRRAATLTGVVSLDGRGTAVGLELVDLATGGLVKRVGSAPVSGEYRMAVFPGVYKFRVDANTLPSGTAFPSPVELSVAADGTISTASGTITTLAITLSRTAALLTGTVTVTRGGQSLPVELKVEAREPQDFKVIQAVVSDPETGAYRMRLAAGSYAIVAGSDSIPPGVLPPAPVTVTVSGTTATGTGVTNNTLDITLKDIRQDGVDIIGTVFDSASGNGLPAELRLFDPINGSVNQNFILSITTAADGSYSLRAVDGTYRLAVFPDSLPPTAIPPAAATVSVQGSSVVESNTTFITSPSENSANDGIVNFAVADGASSGITITGVVTESSNPIGGVILEVVESATGVIVNETFTDAAEGRFTMVLPFGSYSLRILRFSLPFTLIPPASKSILASQQGMTTTVTTNNGATVTPDGQGRYVFDFQPVAASQTLLGTVLDGSGDPVRVFVEILDSFSGAPVAGRFSDIATGDYVIQLSPGVYKARIKPQSLPVGSIAPNPIGINVTQSNILEDSGTSDDGRVDFTLLSAARVISGAVADSNGNPIACFVGGFDAISNEFIGGVPTVPTTGAYSLTVPDGTYKMGIDPDSLPPSVIPPPLTGVQVTGSDVTLNFTLEVAQACITGTVLSAGTGNPPLPAFVVLRDASTNQIIFGSPTTPGTGAFSLCAAPGFYKLRVEPGSLPPGTVAPSPVSVQVTSSGTLEENTVGSGNTTNDGTVNFLVTEATSANLATLTGSVTLQAFGSSIPLGTFIVVEDASTGAFITGSPTDPGSGGSYTLLIPEGTYEVFPDPGSLPPGVALPNPVVITQASGTITQTVGGLPVVSSVLNFALQESSNLISGSVTLGGSGFPCFIVAIDIALDSIVAGVPTDGVGNWSMALPNGSFKVRVEGGSLPPGVLPPASVNVTASSGLILESAGTANDGIIPLILSQSGATLQGFVQNDSGDRLHAFVFAFNADDGGPVAASPTGPNTKFSLPLFDGTFDIVVDPPSLPLDAVPPVPTRLTVSGSNVTISNPGSGSLVGGELVITVTLANQAVSVPVTVQDANSNPLFASIRVRDAFNNLLFIFNVPPTMSGAPVLLGEGTFTLAIDPASVPPGFDVPSGQTVTVASGVASPASVAFTLTQPNLTGTIFNAVSGGTTLIALDLLNGGGQVLNSNVPLTQAGSDATYDVDLGEGTFTLKFRRASGISGTQVIVPRPVNVTVSDGVIQNPDDDSMTAGVQINITAPVVRGSAAGTVTLNGAAVPGLRMVLRNPVDNRVVNEGNTDSSGAYAMAVPSGFFKLRPAPESLVQVAPTALPPNPFEIQVSTTGDLAVVGDNTLCTGGGPNENCTGLDFALIEFNAGTNAVVSGTVTARQTTGATAIAVPGAEVLLIDNTGVPVNSATTNANGAYSLIVQDGIFVVVIDPRTVDLSFPAVPAPPVQITVVGTTINEPNVTGTNNSTNDGTVNFLLEGASALLQGTVQTSNGTGVGALLVITTADQTEFPEDFGFVVPTEPNGTFFLPAGNGSFKIWIDPHSLPPGFLPPAPIVFSVAGSTVTESNTAGTANVANDGIINPVVSSGGGTIRGQVVDASSNPVAAFVALLSPAANPNEPPLFVTGAPTDPADGSFFMTAGNGSYLLELDPFSLPPGIQAPPQITLSVATSGGTTTVTYGSNTETTTDGDGNTVAVLRVSTASNEIRGSILDGSNQPFPGVVKVVDVATSVVVVTAFTNPNGVYSALLADGTFDVKVDPFSLPPGVVAPSPVRVIVDSDAGTPITEANTSGVDPQDSSANQANDGVVNFVLQTTSSTLSGFVRDANTNGIFAQVGLFAPDATGAYVIFVGGAPTTFDTGFFDIPVGNGSFKVKVDPGSLPPGLLPPAPVTISVSGGTITFPTTATTENDNGTTRLVLTLQSAGGGASGQVTDANGDGIPVFVIAEDSTTNEFVGGAPTDPLGNYTIPLPSGSFRIFIDPFSLPQGTVPPTPQIVTVGTTIVQNVDFTLSTAGQTLTGYVLIPGSSINLQSPSVDCSMIASEDVQPVLCSVILVIPAQDANTPPTFLAETSTSPSTGAFTFTVGDGTYEVIVESSTLPPGFIAPPPLTLIVTGSTVNQVGDFAQCTNDTSKSILFVSQSAATINGVVVDGQGNGVGAFIGLTNANDGSFVNGTPTDPSDGSFSVGLGAVSYELFVDPQSVPPGLIPPSPVGVSVVGGQVVVDTVPGVTFQSGLLTITLSTASATVSGTVQDTNGNPYSVLVEALDSADNPIASFWSSPADGSYSLPLAPGVFEIKIASFSLPPGFSPPVGQTVNLFENPNATVNFTLQGTAVTFTGQVFFTSGGQAIGVPAFVELVDPSTGFFLGGASAQPDANGNFVYSIGAGAGSFRLQVAPDSVPPGQQAPAPVGVTVTINSVSGQASIQENAHGSDTNLTDGIVDFELQTAGATLQAQLVTDDGMSGFNGVPGFVRVFLNDGSDTVIAEASTDGSGFFNFSFAAGNYLLFVEPSSLPPGFVAPPATSLTVIGTDVFTNGTQITSLFQIQVFASLVSLTGQVKQLDDTPVPGAFVVMTDPTTQSFVGGTDTGSDGSYQLSLVDGTFLVQVDPFSLPSGFIPPAPEQITVSGTTISQNGSPISSLDLIVGAATASVTVQVVDDFGFSVFTEVTILDATDGFVVTSQSVTGVPVTIGLPSGSFLVTIPSGSVPPGLIPPAPVALTVNTDGTTVDGSGAPGDGFINLVLQPAAASVTGSVTFMGSAVAGVQVIARSLESDLNVANNLTDSTGAFFLQLPVGEYEVFISSGIPTGAVSPAPQTVLVFGGGVVEPSSPLAFALAEVEGIVTGSLTLDGAAIAGEVLAFTDVSGIPVQVGGAQSDANGAYTLNLPVGDITLLAEVDEDSLGNPPPLVIAPLPTTITVPDVTTPTNFTQDFAFFTPTGSGAPVSQVLRGAITAGGSPFDAGVILTLNGDPVALADSSGGNYSMAIIADMSRVFDVAIFADDLPSGFTPPAPVSITVDPTAITGTGVTPVSGEFVLDFTIGVQGIAVTGTVTDASSNPLAGIETRTFNKTSGNSGPSTFTNTSGNYSLILTEGSYEIGLEGIPVGSVRPPDVLVEVINNSGTFSLEIEGQVSTTGVLDFQLLDAVVRLSGQLTVDGAPTNGEVIAIGTGGEVTFAEAFSGTYEIYLPEGALTVVATLSSPTSSVLLPPPFAVNAQATGSIAELTHNFSFVTPDAMNPGTSVGGQVNVDGQGFDTGILIFDANGNLYGLLEAPFGLWFATLPPGTYTISLEDVPAGFTGTSSAVIEVDATGFTGPGVEFGQLNFTLYTTGTQVSGTVTDSNGDAVTGIYVLFEQFPGSSGVTGSQIPFAAVANDGTYQITLPPGEYEVVVDSFGFPSTLVTPPSVDMTVAGTPIVVDFTLATAAGTVSGQINLGGIGFEGEVIAVNASDLSDVTFSESSSDGLYTMNLPAGDFVLYAELQGFTSLSEVITPDPITVTITSSTSLTDVDFDFESIGVTPSQTLQGRILMNTSAVSGELLVLKDLSGTLLPFAYVETQNLTGEESFTIALTPGDYQLQVLEANDMVPTIQPIDLTVTASDIQLAGSPLPNNQLDIQVSVDSVAGTVYFNGQAAASVTVLLESALGGMPTQTTTDSSGTFTFTSLTAGDYTVKVSPTGLPTGAAVPRRQKVTVTSDSVFPSVLRLGLPAKVGDLTGMVSIDGTPVDAGVFIVDRGLTVVTEVPTDMSGNYTVPLPAGTYGVYALLFSGDGSEVPPVPTAINFTGNTTRDILFTTTDPNQVLMGTVTIDGQVVPTEVLVTTDTTPPLPVVCVDPDPSTGAYSIRLPQTMLRVMLAPGETPPGLVAPAPVVIDVTGGGITGTDPDGNAIASNTLDIDPLSATDPGGVRRVGTDVLTAILNRDLTALGTLIADDALLNGQSKTEILADLPTEDEWNRGGRRFDGLQGVVTPVTADEYTLWIQRGREFYAELDGTGREDLWDDSFTNSPEFMVTIRRDGPSLPWLFVGNGLNSGEVFMEHIFLNTNSNGTETPDEEIELIVNEATSQPIQAVTAAGDGITDGTLTEQMFSNGDDEWFAFVDGSSSGPPPFTATLGSFTDGANYTFTVTFPSIPREMVTVIHNAPTDALAPTMQTSVMRDGNVLVTWDEISAQLPRPPAFVEVIVDQTLSMSKKEIFESGDLLLGTSWLVIPGSLFIDGQDYTIEVLYFDTGCAGQGYALELTWPPVSP